MKFLKAMAMRAKAWFNNNAMLLLNLLDLLMPFVAIVAWREIEAPLGAFVSLGICFIVQLAVMLSARYIDWLKEDKTLPKPDKRFTREEKDGEVTIEYARLQELILFMDDYENWLEDNGLREKEEKYGN